MTSPLRIPDPVYIPNAWVDVLYERLVDEMKRAQPGHCLRVADLPRSILQQLTARLAESKPEGSEVYLVDRDTGPEPWRVGVHKVVERRNAGECILLALFPPDLLLAAGDSVDVSTFRAIPVDDVPTRVEEAIAARLSTEQRAWTYRVLNDLDRRGWPAPSAARLAYLATIAVEESDDSAAVGGALFALGLIPDFALLDRPDDVHYRLGQRNIPNVRRLCDINATPLERVLRLPLSDDGFRARLVRFFETRRPEDVMAWGRIVATESEWRDLSLDRWPLGDTAPPPGQVRIDVEPLKLPRRKEDGLLWLDTSQKTAVAWQTTPPAIDVPGLAYFRIEVVSSDHVVAWESPLIKSGEGKTARRSRTIKDLSGLDSGVYFFRVIALNDAGDPFSEQPRRNGDDAAVAEWANDGGADGVAGMGGKRTNESADFLVVGDIDEGDDEFDPVTTSGVRSYAHAELLARWADLIQGKEQNSAHSPTITWTTPLEARSETAQATIQFSLRHQYVMRLSQRLRHLELAILRNPETGGHCRLTLHPQQTTPAEVLLLQLPLEFLMARRDVFAAITRAGVADGAQLVVSLIDLCAVAPEIKRYAEAYRVWLDEGEAQALRLDVTLTDIPEHGTVALMAPTHPLRLLWALQEQQVARYWLREAAERGGADRKLIDLWQETFVPQGLPLMLTLGTDEGYLDAGPLVGGWGAYLPPRVKDSRTVLSTLRARLGSGVAHRSDADTPPGLLADKLDLFVRQHPYTSCLVLNVINPGDAALVVDALVDLERRRDGSSPPLRYEVRLFTDTPGGEVGWAFRELVEPEGQISEAADKLAGPGRSFLFPKLSWSRNTRDEFLAEPDRFAAHVTLILDAFPVELRIAHADGADRTSFVYGLIQGVPRRSTGQQTYAWLRRAAPTACLDLPAAPGRAGLIAAMLAAMGTQQARQLAPNADTTDDIAVASLTLGPKDQSLLYSAHAVSMWVLTLDPHLGLDYFDSARRADRPGYLLDFTPEFVAAGGRQLLLTTSIDAEVSRLMAPAATQLGLNDDTQGAQLLLEALRSLSGRLALRILSAPSQVQGALGMALSRLFLDAYDLLDETIVIPLDAHPELSAHPDPLVARLRGDLLVVRVDATARLIDFLLVEAKCHGGSGLGAELRNEIAAQLASSERALREAFDPSLHDPDRIDRLVQSWRLTGVLDFYLDRALRYALISEASATPLRHFFADLDTGYTLRVRKVGLVFHPDAAETAMDRIDPDLPIWIVGEGEIRRIVESALRAFVTDRESGDIEPESEASVRLSTQRGAMRDDPTWEDVRATFAAHGLDRGAAVRESTMIYANDDPAGQGDASQDGRGVVPLNGALGAEVANRGQPTDEPLESAAPELSDSAAPEYSVLLGDVKPTPQFGLLGTPAAEPWRRVALDLNGCNTISVFGVQGGGKSYTVGAIIEMAVRRIAGLNLLPRPLGAVVFHFHQTQDYPPEFVSMRYATDDPSQVQALAQWGAAPETVEDLVVLTTADTVDLRRSELPGATIAPISFSSSELTVADWRFLMGATGNDALYLKLLNEVMRAHRSNLTLENIRAGLANAALGDAQRVLAETRLDFAARFIDDARSLRSLLKPGRLLVVDLRDEFIEKEQALGLFVTMLNVFSGAGMGSEPFNKLIVFDEAHKYMGGTLIGQVVELIREMRHKGVTVVVASQDPINVPSTVIELSSSVILHRFNSPNWLRHIQKSMSPLADLTPSMMSALAPGEAFIWANRSTDPTFTRRTVKTRIRPRATKHGGSTQTAVDDS